MNASAQPPRTLDRSQVTMIIAGLTLAMLLAALDQTIVGPALPTIGRELGDVEHLPWIVTAYLLAATAVTPLYGKLSDIHGRRITLLISISTFLLGSVFCAIAPTLPLLGLARGFQGIGGGGLISLSQTIIGDIVPPRERPRYQVLIASVFALASLSGPLLGGFFAEHLHWSMIFWINIPIGLLAFSMTFFLLKKLPRHERRHRLDIAGALLLVAATTSLLLTLNWGGVRYAWGSPEILELAVFSALLWTLFVVRLKTAIEPLIPLAILSNNVMACATLAACCAMGMFIGLTIYIPIYFQGVVGLTASESGLALIPLMIGTVTGATIAGRAMVYVTHYKRAPLVGLILAFVVTCILVAKPIGLSPYVVAPLFGLLSVGLGTVFSVSTISIQNSLALHQLGTGLAVMNLFRQLGGALMVAIFGSIVLGGTHGAAEGGLTAMAHDPVALALSFRTVFILVCCGIAVAFIALLRMEERPLVDFSSDRIAAAGE